MEFSVSRGKHGVIVCEDDWGVITFELPRSATDQLDRACIIDIEGGIDLTGMEQWLDSAVIAVRNWLAPHRS